MTLFFIFALYVIPICYVCRTSLNKGRTEISHVVLFSFGFLAYWVSPVALGLIFKDQLGSLIGTAWVDIFLSSGHFNEYFFEIMAVYVAFMSGDLSGKRLKRQPQIQRKNVSPKLLSIIAGAGLLIAVGVIYQARDILHFGQYISDVDTSVARGPIASACIFLFTVAIMYIVQTQPTSVRSFLINRIMMCWWPVSLLLLLIGTRLYFISFVFMLIVYWTTYVRPVAFRTFATLALAGILLMGVIGVYRLSANGGNPLANILMEPIYTSFSLLSFLQAGDVHYLRLPTYLASDIINLVPTVFLPDKVQLMQEIPDIYSPMGAMNSYVSFMSNFGVLGTTVFMFAFGFLMQRMRLRSGVWSTPAYVMISGWSAFALFRDPFSVSLVKDTLEFSMLLPAAICTASSVMKLAARDNVGH